MYASAIDRLNQLIQLQQQDTLRGGLKGLEKESLRVSLAGVLAQTDHPLRLGSALTHPNITTDYSEALLEFITPPFAASTDTLKFLSDLHAFTCQNLQDEMLWATSMPCVVDGEHSIPIARYGTSNIGRMKHVYRHGLWHRYGRTMQAISGIHFNYSVPEALWPVLHRLSNSPLPLSEFISDRYFALIRNQQRIGWLVLYLFGASPALCKTFLCGKPSRFAEFDTHTYYEPYATSLRMSDIGYKNSTQANIGVCYNSLKEYTDCLNHAIETSYPAYEAIGIRDAQGQYQQLNTNILQIENEYYSTSRPKQITQSGEKPIHALKTRGVKYIELRSVDINAFHPVGIDAAQIRFLEAFLLFCLLQDSAPIKPEERKIINQNISAVALRGRDPELRLVFDSTKISLQDWAADICNAMQPLCEVLDGSDDDRPYQTALQAQMNKVHDAGLTPSARQLAEMRQHDWSFFQFARHWSKQHHQSFRAQQLDSTTLRQFEVDAASSIDRQKELECDQSESFEAFLERYFSQPIE